ncbi:MAG: hypothetical protein K0R82_2494 [Flavipsychrobacter sp.]|jgi:hypothetical protein|nr:hypothetical protein [Flavipsychrobacter sp.]
MRRIGIFVLAATLAVVACKKYEDKIGVADLPNSYCNDPEAVNYNWNFPGKPDNSTCFYPDSVFAGTYILSDSVYYSEDFIFSRAQTDTLTISKRGTDSHSQLTVEWKTCNIRMNFTADRFYKATADSLFGADTIIRAGQLFCRPTDTLSGFMMKDRNDPKRLKVNFTIRTDTGSKVVFYNGTAIKQ